MASWPFKDPEEVLDYSMDWTDRLDGVETIDASTWTVAQGAVTIATSPPTQVNAMLTTCWLEGGTLGETCIITNHITTSVGREFEFSGKLKIKAK